MRVQCEQCEKATYKGCGKHVEQVLRGVEEADRCGCAERAAALAATSAAPAKLAASGR